MKEPSPVTKINDIVYSSISLQRYYYIKSYSEKFINLISTETYRKFCDSTGAGSVNYIANCMMSGIYNGNVTNIFNKVLHYMKKNKVERYAIDSDLINKVLYYGLVPEYEKIAALFCDLCLVSDNMELIKEIEKLLNSEQSIEKKEKLLHSLLYK